MGLLGKVSAAGKQAMTPISNAIRYGTSAAAGTMGFMGIAAEHPVLTTLGVLGAGSVLGYGSPGRSAIPAGPASNEVLPGSSQSTSSFDLGASGDLVFALHRLNH